MNTRRQGAEADPVSAQREEEKRRVQGVHPDGRGRQCPVRPIEAFPRPEDYVDYWKRCAFVRQSSVDSRPGSQSA
jgi:hypothetical protein